MVEAFEEHVDSLELCESCLRSLQLESPETNDVLRKSAEKYVAGILAKACANTLLASDEINHFCMIPIKLSIIAI